jgi:hypothetical protein
MTGWEVYNPQHINRILDALDEAQEAGDAFMVSHLTNKLYGEHEAVIEIKGAVHE